MSLGVPTSETKGNDIVVNKCFKDDVSRLQHKAHSKEPACGLSTRRASVGGVTIGVGESIPNVGRRAVRSRHPLVLQGFPVGAPQSETTFSSLQVGWTGTLTSPASRRPRNHRQINDLAAGLPIKTYPSTLRQIYGRYYAKPDRHVKVGAGDPQVKVGAGDPQVKVGAGDPQVKVGAGYPQVKVGAGDQHVTVGAGGLLPRQKIERLLVSSDRKNSLSDSTASFYQRYRQRHHKTYLQLKCRLQHQQYLRQQQLGTQTTLPAEHLLTSHKIPVNPLACRHLNLHTLAYRHKARQHQTPSILMHWHQTPDGATGCKSIKEHNQSNYSRRSEVERASCSKTDPEEEACSRLKLPPISSGGEPRHLDMMEYLWVYQGMSRQVLNLGLRPHSGCEDRDTTLNMARTSPCCYMCMDNTMSASAALTELSRRQILLPSTPMLGRFWVNESFINMATIGKINANKEIKDKVNNSSRFFVREGQLPDSRDSKMLVNGYRKKKIIVTLPAISRDTSSKDIYSED